MLKRNSTSISQCIICMLSTQLWKIQISCRIHTEGCTVFIMWNWQKSKSLDTVAYQVHVMYKYELKVYFCALLLPFPIHPTEYCGCWMMDWRDQVFSVELHPRHAVHCLTFHLQAQNGTTIIEMIIVTSVVIPAYTIKLGNFTKTQMFIHKIWDLQGSKYQDYRLLSCQLFCMKKKILLYVKPRSVWE